MYRAVIVQLLGLMCKNHPENGSNLFGQMYSQLHGQTLRYLVKGENWFWGGSAGGILKKY